jgi:hypothetical protein
MMWEWSGSRRNEEIRGAQNVRSTFVDPLELSPKIIIGTIAARANEIKVLVHERNRLRAPCEVVIYEMRTFNSNKRLLLLRREVYIMGVDIIAVLGSIYSLTVGGSNNLTISCQLDMKPESFKGQIQAFFDKNTARRRPAATRRWSSFTKTIPSSNNRVTLSGCHQKPDTAVTD